MIMTYICTSYMIKHDVVLNVKIENAHAAYLFKSKYCFIHNFRNFLQSIV